MAVTVKEWELLADFYINTYGESHINVQLPRLCVSLHRRVKVPSEKQLKKALQIRKQAYDEGFDFVS